MSQHNRHTNDSNHAVDSETYEADSDSPERLAAENRALRVRVEKLESALAEVKAELDGGDTRDEETTQAADGSEPSSKLVTSGGQDTKVIGMFDADGGVGVYGHNTADSGTTYGVWGEVTSTDGYGLYTPDDARIDGTTELAAISGSLTGDTEVTDIVGSGLSISGGSLTASGSGPSVSDNDTQVLADPDDINFGSNLSVTDDTDGTVTVEASSGGETNSGENLGNGVGVYAGKSGSTLQFKSVTGNSGIAVTDQSTEIDLETQWEDANDLDASGNVTASFIGGLSGGAGIDPSSIGDGDTLSVAWEDANDLDTNGDVFRRTPGRYLSGSQSQIDFSGPAEWGNDGQTNANSAGGTQSTVGGGYNNSASYQYATVGGGTDNEASGSHSTVGGGSGNRATFDLATVPGGDNNTASGAVSTVCGGRDNEASGLGATVTGGKNNFASGNYSFAHGRNAAADDDGAVVFGDWSSTSITSSQTNQFRVQQEDIRLGEGNLTSGSGSPLVYSTATGQVRVDSSSARYKKNIEALSPEPGAILDLEPRSFEYEGSGDDGVGLVAEEVADTIPELVLTDEAGRPESVLYDRLGVYLISEVQRQRDRIDDLERENDTLRVENEDLRDRLNSVEDRLESLEGGQASPVPADD